MSDSSIDSDVAGTQQADKRFCCQVAGIALLGAILAATVNFVVNPYAQYPSRLFKPLVQTSRAQKVSLLKAASPAPNALVLGSSRVMKLEPDHLAEKTGLHFFNAGMNYARVEDLLAYLRFFESQTQAAPKMIVIGIDVAGFSEAPVDARLLSQPQLGELIPEATGFSGRYRRWQELLSWQQSTASLRSLKRALEKTAEDEEPKESYRSDGVLVYHERERAIADGSYDFDSALEYNQREYKHLMAGYRRLSPLRIQLFEEIVRYCKEHETELAVFLTPLHPELNRYLADSTTYLQRKLDLVDFLGGQANENGFTFKDLSEVKQFAGDPQQFVDGIHPLEPNTRKIIDRLLNSMREQTKYVVQ